MVANGEYNKVIPKAKGETDQTIRAAEGYRFERVNEAEGDAAAFSAVLREYVKSPEITRTLEVAGVDPQYTRGPLGGRNLGLSQLMWFHSHAMWS